MDVIVGECLCDWVSLTTYKTGLHKRVRGIVNSYSGTLKDTMGKRFSRYMGSVYEHGFEGVGEQKGQVHYMNVVSGLGADNALSDLLAVVGMDLYKITRIDLQVTVEIGDWYRTRDLKDKVESLNRFKAELRESAGGLDTVYIGSRNSTRFARVYVKSEGLLRFEMEYKNQGKSKAASALFDQLLAGKRDDGSHRPTMKRILSYEVQRRIPDARVRDVFLDAIGRERERVVIQTTELDTKREWISGTVKSGLLGYGVLSHENYAFVREILLEILDILDRAMRLKGDE